MNSKARKILSQFKETKEELLTLQKRFKDTSPAKADIDDWVAQIMKMVKGGKGEGEAKLEVVARIEKLNIEDDKKADVAKFVQGLKDIAAGTFK